MKYNYYRKLRRIVWKLKSKQSDECKSKGASSVEASYVEKEYDIGARVVINEYKGGDS